MRGFSRLKERREDRKIEENEGEKRRTDKDRERRKRGSGRGKEHLFLKKIYE